MLKTLSGLKINLELAEKKDLPIIKQWENDVEFVGEFEPFDQMSLEDFEKQYDGKGERQWYFIEKKDGAKVGYICQIKSKNCVGVGYTLAKEERGKGYGIEAVQMMVDYLFLHKNIGRVQAEIHPDNKASQRVLEKAGFTLEGHIRKSFFCRGVFRNTAMYRILREEWKTPKILPLGYAGKR